MASILDLLQQKPSMTDRIMGLLPLLGALGQPSGGGTLGGLSYGAPGGSQGSVVGPGGPTEYQYTEYDRPYTGVPGNLVTRQGVTLQRGPMRSLVDIARESNILPGIQEIGQIGQGYRPVSAQAAGYAQDPNRFAPPGQSYHGQGLAIDAGWWSERARLANALRQAGWNLPMDYEPWHWSYGVSG